VGRDDLWRVRGIRWAIRRLRMLKMRWEAGAMFSTNKALTCVLLAVLSLGYSLRGPALEFASPVSYPVGASPSAAVVADFNGDGHPDIAVANSGSGDVTVLLNSGDGTFKPAVNFDAGMASPTSIEVADFNHDGILDLAVWTLSDPIGYTLSILLGHGDGTFQAPKKTPLPSGIVLGSVFADFNLDHKPDLALLVQDANSGTSQIFVLAGNGDGTLQAPKTAPLPSGVVLGSVFADFNLDHKPDLALLVRDANSSTSRIFMLAGNGDGTFQPAQPGSDALSTGVGLIGTADFNNDSKPDLAVGVSQGLEILLGQGDGTFQTGATIGVTIGGYVPASQQFELGDFNGDGKVDLLGKFTSPLFACGPYPKTEGGSESWLSLFPGNGDGTFQAEEKIARTGFACGHATTISLPYPGDFNGDGRLDLLIHVHNSDGTYAQMLLGRADGALSVPVLLNGPTISCCSPGTLPAIVMDLNGDKLCDLIYVDSSNNAVAVVLNASPASGADLGIIDGNASGSIYGANIINLGPENATEVTFKDTLPPNTVNFPSAAATQGSCTHSDGFVTCAIGSLAPGFAVSVTVPVTMGPNATDGMVTNSMNVTAAEPDLVPSNNTATQDSAVFTLSVAIAGTGSGTVTSNPSGINCGAACSQHYLTGSSVELTPTASSGSVFTGWTGDCNFTDPKLCAFAISSDMSVAARFDRDPTAPPPSGGGGVFAWWELCGMVLVGLWRRLFVRG
jgi:uncharacterized repeat protein (TIGR01451 family)